MLRCVPMQRKNRCAGKAHNLDLDGVNANDVISSSLALNTVNHCCDRSRVTVAMRSL